MRIAVDCFKLIKGKGKSSGIYNFAIHLVKGLAGLVEQTAGEDELVVFGNGINRGDFCVQGSEYIEVEGYSTDSRVSLVWWELIGAQQFAKKQKADIIIFPRGFCGLFHSVPDMVIIHDMIPFFYDKKYPGYFGKIENAYIMNRLCASARGCRKLVTISEHSKADIIRYSGAAQDKITVINNGYNQMIYKGAGDKNEAPYIIAVATSLPHKNAVGVVTVYEQYFNKCRQLERLPMPLKLVGITREQFDELRCSGNVIFSSELLDNISFEGFILDSAKMQSMIACARVFLFMSLYEGFGFPPLEAMQLGVPVVTSDATSLKEVAGDAAILVSPEDYAKAAESIIALDEDEKMRQDFIMKGYENVKRFEWESVAKKYMSVIKNK